MSDEIAVPSGHGGSRPNTGGARAGAGRPPGSKNNPNPLAKQPWPQTGHETIQSYGQSRAAVEAIKAKNADLHYRIKLAEYIDRESVRSAAAIVISMFAQRIRSIPDDIERKLNASPEVVALVSDTLEEALNDLAARLEFLCGSANKCCSVQS